MIVLKKQHVSAYMKLTFSHGITKLFSKPLLVKSVDFVSEDIFWCGGHHV